MEDNPGIVAGRGSDRKLMGCAPNSAENKIMTIYSSEPFVDVDNFMHTTHEVTEREDILTIIDNLARHEHIVVFQDWHYDEDEDDETQIGWSVHVLRHATPEEIMTNNAAREARRAAFRATTTVIPYDEDEEDYAAEHYLGENTIAKLRNIKFEDED